MNTLKNNHDIYGYEHRFNKAVVRVKEDPGVTENNKNEILKFAEFKRAQGRSLARLEKFVNTVLPIALSLAKDLI